MKARICGLDFLRTKKEENKIPGHQPGEPVSLPRGAGHQRAAGDRGHEAWLGLSGPVPNFWLPLPQEQPSALPLPMKGAVLSGPHPQAPRQQSTGPVSDPRPSPDPISAQASLTST